jgi:hypothetical protein
MAVTRSVSIHLLWFPCLRALTRPGPQCVRFVWLGGFSTVEIEGIESNRKTVPGELPNNLSLQSQDRALRQNGSAAVFIVVR